MNSWNKVFKHFLICLFTTVTSNPRNGCLRRNRHLRQASPMKRIRRTDVSALFNSLIPVVFIFLRFFFFSFFSRWSAQCTSDSWTRKRTCRASGDGFLEERREGSTIPTHTFKCSEHMFLSRLRCEECDGFGPVVNLRCQSNPSRHSQNTLTPKLHQKCASVCAHTRVLHLTQWSFTSSF